MDRNRQLLRGITILHDLLTRGSRGTVVEWAEHFRVHPKTIRRDLKAIAESPFALASIEEDGERIFFLEESPSRKSGT
jgi:hypothetical protein